MSFSFEVTITDFVFDHASRPMLSRAGAFILGVGSLITFVLTTLGQIDTSLGVTSGTTAAGLSGLLLWQFTVQYQRQSVKHNSP